MAVDERFWNGKRVLVTGHTGFKGSWLTLVLLSMGARVRGFSDDVPTRPALYELAGLAEDVESVSGDVADASALAAASRGADVALHLAAQPLVRRSLREPLQTWQTNALGTAAFLEAVRVADVPCAVVVTSDKCYRLGRGTPRRARLEDDAMGGDDPYSASKGAAELAVEAWRRSYGLRVASARAGNAIGGGDWGQDRLVADVMRAAAAGTPVEIRSPDAVRPWQHVLDPLSGYLELAQALAHSAGAADAFNFGPDPGDAQPVRHIVQRIAELWPSGLEWRVDSHPHPREAPELTIDSSRARERLGWSPLFDLDTALQLTVEWHLALRDADDVRATTLRHVERHRACVAA